MFSLPCWWSAFPRASPHDGTRVGKHGLQSYNFFPKWQNGLFNPNGDTDLRLRRMIGGNTTNLNDFNNVKYDWTSNWYRQAMNNFWIPEEINLSQDVKDYAHLEKAERKAYDKILSFLVFLDSLQSNNLPCISEYITANEVNLCLHIQAFQECVHSQSYSYMLDSICSPEERNAILYQWKTDDHLLRRNTFIGECYNEFHNHQDKMFLMKALTAKNMKWVALYSNANMVKTDFFEAKSTAYAKSVAIEDDL